MRVLIATQSLSDGGAEFVAVQWARYLASVGDRVTMYTTHPHENDVAPEGVSLVQAQTGNIIAKTRDLARYLRQERVDLVIAVLQYCNLVSIGAARSLGAQRPKVVISEHTLSHGPPMVYSGRHVKTRRWLARRTYRYADQFVAVSHAVGAEAIAEYGLSPERLTVIPNPALAKIDEPAANHHAPPSDPGHLDIVVPGRLVPPKRPLLAVDVAAIVSQAFPNGVTVHYFGDGPLAAEIDKHARSAGVDVIMHGWVENWFDACPAGSIVLLTSVLEGFGNVLVEAAAVGLKSVASSRCMGVGDAVVPGLTGELTAGDSAQDYAEAVLATSRDAVHDVQPWLRRFSFESSGEVLRAALVRVANRARREA